MKFKVTLKVKQKGQLLPLSYQYEMSSWIYKVINKGNNEFANFLHSKGYELGKKKFKLFTFSRLYVNDYKIIQDRMKIWSEEVYFYVSFFVDKAAQHLIVGLLEGEAFRLGDSITQVEFKVKCVEPKTFSIEKNLVKLTTVSPMMVGKPMEGKNGKLTKEYLNPRSPDFEKYFFQNLIAKYLTAKSYGFAPDVDINEKLHFRLLSKNIKKQGVKIKAHTKAETKIIGYQFDFELTAPKELIEIGLLAGFGGENAMGFGATKLIN